MAKQGSTKEEIKKLISRGKNTLSDISSELNLAPSTVSKHLEDLQSAGTIEQIENEHIKKWKYYRVVENQPNYAMGSGIMAMNKNKIMPFVALIALLAVAGLYIYHSSAVIATSAQQQYVPISITDPPQVPNGTQALYVNYSSFNVQVEKSGHVQWVPVNISGRLDLMNLINATQLIGGVSISANSTVDQVRFNITSASIVLSNITYPVRITNNQIVARLTQSQINSTSGILLDSSPVVTQMYVDNTTQFVMLSAVKAYVVPKGNFGNHFGQQSNLSQNGSRRSLNQFERNEIAHGDSDTQVSITNVTLTITNSSTSFTVTLHNNGTENVTVMGLGIMPNEFTMFPLNHTSWAVGNYFPWNSFNGNYLPGNAFPGQSPHWPGGPAKPIPGWPFNGPITSPFNGIFNRVFPPVKIQPQTGSNSSQRGAWITTQIHAHAEVQSMHFDSSKTGNSNQPGLMSSNGTDYFGHSYTEPVDRNIMGMSFLVSSNGTLSLPGGMYLGRRRGDAGYVLVPGASVTLHYSESSSTPRFIKSSVGSAKFNYRVLVMTDEGPVSSGNFTVN